MQTMQIGICSHTETIDRQRRDCIGQSHQGASVGGSAGVCSIPVLLRVIDVVRPKK